MDRVEVWIELGKLAISILGFGGTIAALSLGVRQYRRNQLWKRAQFIAGETKEFAENRMVRSALTMVDWSTRRVNLSGRESPNEEDLVVVTREDQWKALLPHTVKNSFPSTLEQHGNSEGGVDSKRKYSPKEALIRDCYDSFLDWLERFDAFIETGLISAAELQPHIKYWIEDIATIEGTADDSRWRCSLFVYIHFYRFDGVKRLFARFGKDIAPDSPLYKDLEAKSAKAELTTALRAATGR